MIKLKDLLEGKNYNSPGYENRGFGDPLPTLEDITKKYQEGKEDVNENLLKQIKQAEKIAKSMAGNMTGAVKGIEKIRRGLSHHKRVKVALKKYNESVDEGKLSEDYKNSEWEVYVADENGKEKIVKKAKSKRAGVILYNKLINSDNYYEVGMRVVKESVNEETINEAPEQQMASQLNKVSDTILKITNKFKGKADVDGMTRSWMMGLHARLKKAGIKT